MARYVKDLVLNKPEDFVTFIMNDYLQKNQFVVSEWKGEPAYRTGDALIEGYKNEMAAKQGMNGANGQSKPQPVQVKTVDNSSAATMALVFGILAFGISFLSPLISIILAILGYSRARIGMQSALKGRAKAGRNFCIVAIVLSIILWVTNLVLTIMVR